MPPLIKTPDQRLRVFVSSTLGELAAERGAVRHAIERLRLTPVMFELGARPHPPRALYRAYLEQSHVFVGIYWERYGWVAPGETVSGLEDEYRLAGDRPRLLYVKDPAPDRDQRLSALLADLQTGGVASYRRFTTADELAALVEDDLALLLSERFEGGSQGRGPEAEGELHLPAPPTPLTPTIGRAAEVDEIVGAVRGGDRLVTITGVGGVGKTRLALEVAHRLAGDFSGAVCFVALAAATDPDDALRAVATALSVRTEATTAIDALAAQLRGRRALVVLDNVEQIDDIGTAVVSLLERAPKLQVVATSRRALRVRGEHEHRLGPLPTPELGDDPSEVRASPAVSLFLDRALAVGRSFDTTDDDVRQIADVVRQLDGLPLAIELAAAQMRLQSLDGLRDRLAASLDAIPSSFVDLPDRQRTLRATLDWSYDLLTGSERSAFSRLSVFAGGWTLDAADAVCAHEHGVPLAETIAGLLDKSLVVADQDDDGTEPRFRMLGLVRSYAAERLSERSEAAAVRGRHLDWYRHLAERAQPGLCGPGQREWVARMAPERADLNQAVAHALEIGDFDAVIELAWDVVVLYFVRDAVEEPRAWLRAVTEVDPPLDAIAAAKLRSLYALTRIHAGDYRGVHDALLGPLAVFRDEGMDFERAVVLHQLGFVRYHLDDDVEGAVAALEESGSLFASIDHDWGVSLTSSMLGSVFASTGDLSAAEQCQLRALEHARKIESEQQTVQAVGQLALVRLLQERYDDALRVLGMSIPVLISGGYRTDAANALDVLAVIAHHRGNASAAADALCVADAERARLGVEPWPTLQSFIDRITRWVRGSLGDDVFATIVECTADRDVLDVLREIYEGLVGGERDESERAAVDESTAQGTRTTRPNARRLSR